MDGILNVNKPAGPTSHDVVARLRRAIRPRRIGHAGTLDPSAEGVLVICLNNATRIIEYLMDWPKEYHATAVLGAETDTQDATGEILRETDCLHITREDVEAVIPRFVGTIMQVPPMVSAVHHKGRRLYQLAREGKVVEREPRPVDIYSLALTDFEPGAKPILTLDVKCSRGTYIRTLCADIGQALGCGGYMRSLVRTAVGPLAIENAYDVETIEAKVQSGQLQEILFPIGEALSDMPSVEVSGPDASLIANGVMLADRFRRSEDKIPEPGRPVRILGPGGELLAIGSLRRLAGGEMLLKPDKVFAREG